MFGDCQHWTLLKKKSSIAFISCRFIISPFSWLEGKQHLFLCNLKECFKVTHAGSCNPGCRHLRHTPFGYNFPIGVKLFPSSFLYSRICANGPLQLLFEEHFVGAQTVNARIPVTPPPPVPSPKARPEGTRHRNYAEDGSEWEITGEHRVNCLEFSGRKVLYGYIKQVNQSYPQEPGLVFPLCFSHDKRGTVGWNGGRDFLNTIFVARQHFCHVMSHVCTACGFPGGI